MDDFNITDPINLIKKIPPSWLPLFYLVGNLASVQNLKVYLVGGSVRDFYLGFPVTDVDVVLEGDAIRFANFLSGKFGGSVKVHDRFGTAVWSLDGNAFNKLNLKSLPSHGRINLDFISARSESYKFPGALPTVKPGTLREDLLRRDFTINTLAMKLTGDDFGELINDLGGLEDLQGRCIRVLHPNSFIDDPTRLFRVFRYEQRYHFMISEETLALIPPALFNIDRLSAKRVRHELDLIMEERYPTRVLNRLSDFNILKSIHPALVWNDKISKRMTSGVETAASSKIPILLMQLGWALWLMDSSHQNLRRIDERLHYNGDLRKILEGSITLRSQLIRLSNKHPSQCVALLDGFPLPSVQAEYLGLDNGPAKEILGKYLSTWRFIKQKTTGKDLIKRNLPPGPAFQEILGKLRDAWLDGKIRTEEEEERLLTTLINKNTLQ